MVEIELQHSSYSFDMDMPINIIIKNEESKEQARILYLLHGYSGNNKSWNRSTSLFRYLRQLKVSYPIFVIMPSVLNTYYSNTSPFYKSKDYIAKELPQFIQSIFPQCTHDPLLTNIAGLSMGGYGSLLMGLLYPKRFLHVASFAGATDFAGRFIHYHYDLTLKRSSDIEPHNRTLSCSTFVDTDADLFYLAKRLNDEEKQFTNWYMYCGTDDFLLEENRAFSKHLLDADFPLEYSEQQGYEHNWEHWDLCIKDILPNMFPSS